MKQVSFLPIGTTVYTFIGFDFKIKETVVENVEIKVPDVGEPLVHYVVDISDDHNARRITLPAKQVFEDKEKLKEVVLSGFNSEPTQTVSADAS